MKTNLFLIHKYWSKHKKQAVMVLSSIVILIASVLCSLLLQVMEQRRELHRIYDSMGHYSMCLAGVDDSIIDSLANNNDIEKIGKITVVGMVGLENLAIGSADSIGIELLHYPLKEGNLPTKKGEIAISELVLPKIAAMKEIGDTVTLDFTDSNGDTLQKSWILVGIIDENTSRDDNEYSKGGLLKNPNTNNKPTPLIIISEEETQGYTPKYQNALILDTPEFIKWEDTASGEEVALWYENIFKSDIYSIGGWENTIIKMIVPDATRTNSVNISETGKTETVKIIELISWLMAAVAFISVFCILNSIYLNRINDFQLLKCVGHSKKSLLKMFILEGLIFLVLGIIIGLLIGVTFYNLIYYVQVKYMELTPYNAISPEWIIREISGNPLYLPIISVCIVMLLAYIFPIIKLFKLTPVETRSTHTKQHGKSKLRLSSMLVKVYENTNVRLVQCAALTIVMCTSMFGYLYYSDSGKNGDNLILSYLSNSAYQTSDYQIGELVPLNT